MKSNAAMKLSTYKSTGLLAFAVLGWMLLFPTAQAQDETSIRLREAEALIQQPLNVNVSRQGTKSQMRLMEIANGQLIFQVGNQNGEASMPLDGLGDMNITVDTGRDYIEAVGQVNNESFNPQQLDLLRQRNYPMLRFMEIPRQNSTIHQSIKSLFAGLLQMEHFDEALLLLDHIKAETLDPDFENLAIRLAMKLTEQQSYERASEVFQKISIETVDLINFNAVMEIAEIMRARRDFAAAQDLYSRLADNDKVDDLGPKYWAYYCGIYLEQYEEDHLFREEVEQIEPGEALFSLQQLILGTYYLNRKQYARAMKSISEGIAYARPIDPWTDELMYRSAQAYEALGEEQIAAAVYEETQKFFPASDWATLAQEAFERIRL